MRRHAVHRSTEASRPRRTRSGYSRFLFRVAPPVESGTRPPSCPRSLPSTTRRGSCPPCRRVDAGGALAPFAPAIARDLEQQSAETRVHGVPDTHPEAGRRRSCVLRDRAGLTRTVARPPRGPELHRVAGHTRHHRSQRPDGSWRPLRQSPSSAGTTFTRRVSTSRSGDSPASPERATARAVAHVSSSPGEATGRARPAFARSCGPRTSARASIFSVPSQTKQRWQLLRTAAILVFMSRFDGPPRPIREALSVGTPCLVSYESNMGELVEKFGAGRAASLEPAAVARCLHEAFRTPRTLDSWRGGRAEATSRAGLAERGADVPQRV